MERGNGLTSYREEPVQGRRSAELDESVAGSPAIDDEEIICGVKESDVIALYTPERIAFLLILTAFIIFFSIDAVTNKYTEKLLESLVNFLINLKPIEIIAIYLAFTVLAVVITLPMSLAALSGGYLFAKKFGFGIGVLIATAVNITGFTVGAMICFWLAMTILYDPNFKVKNEYFDGLDIAMKRKGLLINILLRMLPVIHGSMMNYGMPLLGTNLLDFSLGCFIGTLPYSFFVSLLGAELNEESHMMRFFHEAPVYMSVLAVLLTIAILAAVTWITYEYAKMEIQAELDSNEAGDEAKAAKGNSDENEKRNEIPLESSRLLDHETI